MTANQQKILIVEDSPTMRQLYRMALSGRQGTDLIFAVNGVDGLDRLAQEPELALMIVDINMPQMDGLEFLRRARRELGASQIPAIVISTEGAESDRNAARDAGASGYLRKPWTSAQLLASIDELVLRPGVR